MSERTVLVVDDSAEDRAVVQRALARSRDRVYTLREAETGDDGLAACRAEPPDCVLLDLNLPDMDGMEFLDVLSSGAAAPPVPVVLLTGVNEDTLVAAALKRGAQDYLVKGETTPVGLERAITNAMEKFAVARELTEQQRRLERKNRELEAYTSVVAHDLRNPLGAIRTSAQFLLDVVPESPEREMERQQLALIVRAVDRTNHLVADLLDVSRIEAGSLVLECDFHPAAELVREAAELHRLGPAGGRHPLAVETAASLPSICVDRDRLLRVFQNLLDNAAKFTPDGGRIALRAAPHEGGVRFEVEDTGVGIPADQLPHIFDRFWQAERTDSRGLGLGLAITHGIVTAHGGELEVESTPGEGTCFRFTLPPEGPGEGEGG